MNVYIIISQADFKAEDKASKILCFWLYNLAFENYQAAKDNIELLNFPKEFKDNLKIHALQVQPFTN